MAPKKESTPARQPVTARGTDLLALIAADPNGYLFLTQDEGKDIVAAGDAMIRGDVTAPAGLAAVTLTDAGKVKLSPPAVTSGTKLAVRKDIPLPTAKACTRGRGSKYPFDTMEVGESFHIPKTKENPDPANSIASSLTGARNRFAKPAVDADGKPIMENVVVKEYVLGADGKRVKDAAGHFILKGEKVEAKPKMVNDRDFVVSTVGSDDPDGEGARVWRSK